MTDNPHSGQQVRYHGTIYGTIFICTSVQKLSRVQYWYHIHILITINYTHNSRKNRCHTKAVREKYKKSLTLCIYIYIIFYQLLYHYKTRGKYWRATTFCQPLTTKEGMIHVFLIPLNPNIHSKLHENSIKSCNFLNLYIFWPKWYHIGTIF